MWGVCPPILLIFGTQQQDLLYSNQLSEQQRTRNRLTHHVRLAHFLLAFTNNSHLTWSVHCRSEVWFLLRLLYAEVLLRLVAALTTLLNVCWRREEGGVAAPHTLQGSDSGSLLCGLSPGLPAGTQTGLAAQLRHVGAPPAGEGRPGPAQAVGHTAAVLKYKLVTALTRRAAGNPTGDTGSGWLLFCSRLEELRLLWALEWRLRRTKITFNFTAFTKVIFLSEVFLENPSKNFI